MKIIWYGWFGCFLYVFSGVGRFWVGFYLMKIHKEFGCVANKTLVTTILIQFTVLIQLMSALKGFMAVFTCIFFMLCLVNK